MVDISYFSFNNASRARFLCCRRCEKVDSGYLLFALVSFRIINNIFHHRERRCSHTVPLVDSKKKKNAIYRSNKGDLQFIGHI